MQPKFDKSDLHRRPEFAEPSESKPNIPSTSNASTSYANSSTASTSSAQFSTSPNAFSNATASSSKPLAHNADTSSSKPVNVKIEPLKPLSSIPAHMRTELATSTPNTKAKPPVPHATTMKSGLQTPITTPDQVPTRPLSQVSPANQPAIAPQCQSIQDHDPEKSFSFNSDDDAFFAAVDLGEGELGRPIDFEEGTGGISLSEGSDVFGEGQQRHSVHWAEQQQQQTATYTTAPINVHQQQQSRPIQNQNHGRKPTRTTATTNAQQQRSSAPGQAPAARSNQYQNHNSDLTTTTTASLTSPTLQRAPLPRYTPASRSYQNQNHNPATTDTTPAVNANVIKNPTSTGGFYFPPGMVCLDLITPAIFRLMGFLR
jgi:DNA repair and recombination protein RAD52